MMELSVNLPNIVEVDDYHEFQYIEDYFRILNPKIKIREIGFNGYYWGVVYVGKCPTKKEIKALAEKLKIPLDEQE